MDVGVVWDSGVMDGRWGERGVLDIELVGLRIGWVVECWCCFGWCWVDVFLGEIKGDKGGVMSSWGLRVLSEGCECIVFWL